MSKPKGILITPEQHAALTALGAAFAPKQPAKRNRKPKATTIASAATDKPPEVSVTAPAVSEGRKRKNTNSRPFWTDGQNAYLRRKKVNPAMRERIDEKVRTGEYKHVRTSDDVEIYKIADWSNLKRKAADLTEISANSLERAIVRAACKHDYRTYYDASAELAARMKNSDLPHDLSMRLFQQQMGYIEQRIARRGGPSPMTIQNELRRIRKERTGSSLYLPRTH